MCDNKKSKGFTLIELLITIVIVAILTAIAVPTYRSYVTKSNRSEGLKTLLAIQLAQEKYRATNSSYGNLATIWGLTETERGYYTLASNNETGSSYTLTATANGTQTDDTGCTTLTLTYSNGTTTRTPVTCWD